MSIQLKYQLEQRIDKAIKQLPYSQSKEDFVLTALMFGIEQRGK